MDETTKRDKTFAPQTNGKSAGTLMKEVTEDLSTLVRQEVELAKQELGRAISAKVKGAVTLAVVGVMALFALIFFLLAVRDGLDVALPTWLADILTGAILLVIGALAALFARKKLSTPISAEMTKQSVKQDVELAKSLGRKNP